MIASIKPQEAEEILKKIVSLYLDSSLKLMKGIKEAVEGNDAEALHRDAHTLKSSSANVGAMAFAEMCRELEMIGRDKTVEGAQVRMADLEYEYGRVREYLQKYA